MPRACMGHASIMGETVTGGGGVVGAGGVTGRVGEPMPQFPAPRGHPRGRPKGFFILHSRSTLTVDFGAKTR